MNSYLQVTNKHLLDYKTWKFIYKGKAVKPFEVEVPFYLWDFKETTEHRVAFSKPISRFTKVYSIHLKDLMIHFQLYGYKMLVEIKFVDPKSGSWRTMTLRVEPELNEVINPVTEYLCNRVDYQLHTGDGVISHHTRFGSSFHTIEGLGNKDMYPIQNNSFGYGLKEKQFNVEYQGRKLGGKSYVYICGSWGILLSDDFSFDSLVLFTGLVNGTVGVERVLYTINPYVQRVVQGLV